jgi:hypothetical protein
VKLNQDGQPGPYPNPDAGSAVEISLDVEMVTAICPRCTVKLYEANSNGFSDLLAAEDEAVAQGTRVVSNSWGTGEFSGENSFDGSLDHPGVAITFSSGDGAYQGGVQYPSASPYVTSVGGTELTPTSKGRGWKETAWVTPGNPPTQGSGSGCSGYEYKPPWQTDPGCANRMTADASAVAADVSFYDTYSQSGWLYGFGTSVSSPLVAAVYGLEKNPASGSVPASAIYAAPAYSLHDIVKGSEGSCSPAYFCTAVKGYDGPTGRGSPKGAAAFKVKASGVPTITSVSESGSPSDPTITITGSNLWPTAPTGTPEPCNPGDPGDNFGSGGLWITDNTAGWTAGQYSDCIGLVIQSWSTTSVVFGFGDTYGSYTPAQPGDSIEVDAQMAYFNGALSG